MICIDEHWFIHSRNVIVRLNGTSGRDEALLINAHYGKLLYGEKGERDLSD